MSEKIMIIDDEPDIIFLLRDFFLLNDYEVITANSAEEAMRYAFEPYYTEENKNQGVHYGLGLAICKTLCDKMKGRISCRNNNGAEVMVEI